MSCQQASRLTDDPYAFTEPTTIIQTGSIYQSSLLNREKKINSNGIVGGSQPISAVSVNYSNGVINKNSTIYTQTIAKQQRSQQQPLTFHSAFSKQIQQHTVKSPATTNKSLLATGKSVKLVKPASNLPQKINQNVLKTNLVVPDNNSKRNIINHSSNNSHSSTPSSSSSSDVPVVSPPLNAHLILGNTAYSPNYKNQIQPIAKLQKTDSTNLSLGGQTGSSNIFVQQSFTPTSSIIPVTHNTALLPTVNTFKTTIASPKSFLQTPISVKASEVSNGHNNITFAMPKQQNGKSGVHVPSSGHKLSSVMKITPVAGIVNNPPIPITGQSGKSTTSGKRGKRSYSNTSHNETVQRISESSDSMLATGSGKMKIKPVIAIPVKREWHAPDSYVYDYTSPHASIEGCLETSSLVQNNWFIANFAPVTVNVKAEELCPSQQGISSQLQSDSIVNKSVNSDNLLNKLTRDERLQIKRANLRRKAVQYWSGQNLRNNLASKRRLINAWKVFSKLEQQRIDSEKEPLSYNTIDEFPSNKCSIANCKQKPLVMTSFCYQHITCNTEQRLFHSCTAKFSDNTQCRVPVFDISHELPLCTEHAWKRDNYNKMLQEMKPKKPPRKKPKPSAMTRPSKRNKKKKKIQPQNHQPILPPPPQYSTLYPNYNKITPSGQMKLENDLLPGLVVQNNSNDTINMYHPQTQDFLSICENSSAYASSEDTGVGGLSESELMVAQDVIENIPFIETHELTNVLNQIPADAFHELFSEQQNTFEPTQEEQDHLDFVLEAVDKHVKNLEQMTEESTNFLGDFLDNVDEEMLNTDICTDQILQTC